MVRFDNERGKGDHRQVNGSETKYAFIDVDGLLADFNADIERWSREHDRS